MATKYSPAFKAQAVEKALLRRDDVSQSEVAASLGIAESTLSKWISRSKDHALESKQNGHPTDSAPRSMGSDSIETIVGYSFTK